jgi:WD40 repeat protein
MNTANSDSNGPIWGANISPDGSVVAIRSGGGARIYDSATGAKIAFFSGTPWRFAFSPDSKFLACGFDAEYEYSKALIQVWNLESEELHIEYDAFGPNGKFWGLEFNSNGELLAGCSRGSSVVKVWRTHDWSLLHELTGHSVDRNESVAFSHDNQTIVTGGNDGTVRLWDSSDGNQLLLFDAHSNSRITSVSVHPDDERIASAGHKGEVKVWDRSTGNIEMEFQTEDYCNFVAFIDDEVCVADGGGDLFFWNISTGELVERIQAIRKRGHTIFGGSNISRDRSTIVTAGWHGCVKTWDARSRKLLSEFGYDIESKDVT